MVNTISDEKPFIEGDFSSDVVVEKPSYVIEKITRSCDRSISVNFHTYKVSTTMSASVKDKDATLEDIKRISSEVYKLAEEQTLLEINKIREVLSRGN